MAGPGKYSTFGQISSYARYCYRSIQGDGEGHGEEELEEAEAVKRMPTGRGGLSVIRTTNRGIWRQRAAQPLASPPW